MHLIGQMLEHTCPCVMANTFVIGRAIAQNVCYTLSLVHELHLQASHRTLAAFAAHNTVLCTPPTCPGVALSSQKEYIFLYLCNDHGLSCLTAPA